MEACRMMSLIMEVERDILIGFVEDKKSIDGEKVKLNAVAW